MISISNNSLTATINPHGAELISLKGNNREYIWEGNPEFWGKHSPILFPIVGTLKNNSYNYKGNSYTMTRHGFARDNKFTATEITDNSVTFTLVSDDNTRKAYPFDFELSLKYTLKDTTLFLGYMVSNNGTDVMPFSIGAHPAFALPGNFNSYSLKFEKEKVLVSTELENDLLSSKTVTFSIHNGELPLSYDLFKHDALIFKNIKSDFIDIMQNNMPFVRVNFKSFPHLGIWTKENAPFICIEPWHGYSDLFNSSGDITEKEGIIMLEPGKQFSAGFSIEVLN